MKLKVFDKLLLSFVAGALAMLFFVLAINYKGQCPDALVTDTQSGLYCQEAGWYDKDQRVLLEDQNQALTKLLSECSVLNGKYAQVLAQERLLVEKKNQMLLDCIEAKS